MAERDTASKLHRLGHLVEGEWVAYSHAPVFRMPRDGETSARIVAGVPASDPTVFGHLIECLAPPYFLLYVLHTPRGEAAAGRYQSPLLSLDDIHDFLARFARFLSADARFDLWAHSSGDNATVVWDRHDQLFGYGPLKRFESKLRSIGFVPGSPEVPVPHQHHYRAEFDDDARDVIAAFDWSHSPLRDRDEQ